MNDSSHFSICLPAFGVSVPDFGHSNRWVVVSCFNLHFPDDICYGTSFQMCIYQLCIFYAEKYVKVFCPFYNRVAFLSLSLKSSLHILDKNLLLDVYSENTFFPDCGLTSHYVDIVFHRTVFFPFFILIKSKLLCLFFMDLPLILYLKSHGLSQGHLDFPLWYLLRILQFCFLHLSLWFILSFFFLCEGYKYCI